MPLEYIKRLYLTKLERLKDILLSYKKVAIAFSGGVDSVFLAYMAREYLKDVLLITVDGDMVSRREIEDSKKVAESLQLKHIIKRVDIKDIEKFTDNPKDRCYYCKKFIFENIIELAGNYIVLDGSNFDDLDEYRPGFRAIKELGIKSPLLMAELTKKEIREYSKRFHLETYNKPSNPCLATRVLTDKPIDKKSLFMIERAEDILYDLGFRNFRVRHHDLLARIETDELEKILKYKEDIDEKLKEIGYKYVSVDLNGYKRGSMNV